MNNCTALVLIETKVQQSDLQKETVNLSLALHIDRLVMHDRKLASAG